MSKDILSVENITMQFGGVVAVNNLSLHIPEGQIVALIGPNGAGKTTAFNCITGVYEPTNGLVKFLDEPMVRNHPTGKMKKLYKGARRCGGRDRGRAEQARHGGGHSGLRPSDTGGEPAAAGAGSRRARPV